MYRIILSLCLLLIMACTSPLVLRSEPSPQRLPLATMTPVPRTPRPTLTASPTATVTGTPLSYQGETVAIIEDNVSCPSTIAEAEADPNYRGHSVSDLHSGTMGATAANFTACVYSETQVQLDAYVESNAPGAGYACAITDLHPGTHPGWTHAGSVAAGPCNHCTDSFGDTTLWPVGRYYFSLLASSPGGDVGCDTWSRRLVIQPQAPQATPGPTPTPGTGCWIAEVLTRPDQDWNGRGGIGNNDEYIEVGCNPTQNLSGWELATTSTFTYTIATDNLTGPLKVFWGDEWNSGQVSMTLPLTGTVKLYNAAGTLVDTRDFYSEATGSAWAAAAWTNPGGVWWYFPPSPGH